MRVMATDPEKYNNHKNQKHFVFTWTQQYIFAEGHIISSALS